MVWFLICSYLLIGFGIGATGFRDVVGKLEAGDTSLPEGIYSYDVETIKGTFWLVVPIVAVLWVPLWILTLLEIKPR